MKQLFIELQGRLASLQSLKHVDEDWGQLDTFGNKPPVKFPCALLNLGDVNWSNMGQLKQIGQARITITFADYKLVNTSDLAPQRQKDAAFSLLGIMSQANLLLHGWRPSVATSPMVRLSQDRAIRDDGIIEHTVVYLVTVKDDHNPTVVFPEGDLPADITRE